MNIETEKAIREILLDQIIYTVTSAPAEKINPNNIWISSENREVPTDDDLYISVGLADSVFLTSTNSTQNVEIDGVDVLQEVQATQQRENIQIDIFSSGRIARQVRGQVMQAMNSIKARQVQERESFKIYRLPSGLTNTSGMEGGNIINRFTIVVPCLVWYRRIVDINNTTDIYDQFSATVDDEETIGTGAHIAEINIP